MSDTQFGRPTRPTQTTRFVVQNRYQDSGWEDSGFEYDDPNVAGLQALRMARQPMYYGMTRVWDRADGEALVTYPAGGADYEDADCRVRERERIDQMKAEFDRTVVEDLATVRRIIHGRIDQERFSREMEDEVNRTREYIQTGRSARASPADEVGPEKRPGGSGWRARLRDFLLWG